MRISLSAVTLAYLAVACLFAVLFTLFHVHRLTVPKPAGIGFALRRIRAGSLLQKPALNKAVNALALIRAAAQKHRVPTALVKSIVAAESNFDADAISPKGAIGLMQLMPETAEEYGADPTIPEQNIEAGTRYLHFLMRRYRKYGNSLSRVIAAYNAGPGCVDRYDGVPPYRETRWYVVRVMAYMRHFRNEPG